MLALRFLAGKVESNNRTGSLEAGENPGFYPRLANSTVAVSENVKGLIND
jgi:hypothetical protein